APEIFSDENDKSGTTIWSNSVDVYSFAIVLWEMCHRRVPFEEQWNQNIDVIDLTISGFRLAIEEHVPVGLRQLIESCWHQDPARRPSFFEISNVLREMSS